MIRFFRQLPGSLRELVEVLGYVASRLDAVVQGLQEDGGLADRVAEMERTLERRDAQTRALLEEVEARFRASRSSEERARHMIKRMAPDDEEAPEGDEEGPDAVEEWLHQVQASHAARGEEGGVQPVPSDVAPISERETLRQLKLQGY